MFLKTLMRAFNEYSLLNKYFINIMYYVHTYIFSFDISYSIFTVLPL